MFFCFVFALQFVKVCIDRKKKNQTQFRPKPDFFHHFCHISATAFHRLSVLHMCPFAWSIYMNTSLPHNSLEYTNRFLVEHMLKVEWKYIDTN